MDISADIKRPPAIQSSPLPVDPITRADQMATIGDGDELLLAKIGYEQVGGSETMDEAVLSDIEIESTLYQVLDAFLRCFYLRCTGISTCNVRKPIEPRWPSIGGMGMGDRVGHGSDHIDVWYVCECLLPRIWI